jgi:hypothetical protein
MTRMMRKLMPGICNACELDVEDAAINQEEIDY